MKNTGGVIADAPAGGEFAINYVVINGYKTAPAAASFVTGDVDLSGEVSVLDVTRIQQYLANLGSLDAQQLGLADTDLKGYVDIVDATRIQRFLAGIISAL